MNNKDLAKVLGYIEHLPDETERGEARAIILQSAVDSAELKKFKLNIKGKVVNKESDGKKYLKYTQQEIKKMPDYLQKLFVVDNKIITYRVINGTYYQARYRRDGYNVTACSKDFGLMKSLFIQKFMEATEQMKKKAFPKLEEYIVDWMRVKKQTVKETTYRSYELLVNKHVLPVFGKLHLNEITRKSIQDYLFDLTEEGKNRTAQKLKQLLSNMFDMITEDFELKNPMNKIVLSPYVVKKGTALSVEEEAEVIKYCKKNSHYFGNSAILLLMYTGMRHGELASIEVFNDYLTCVSEKIRKGYADVIRKIPFSPMLKKIIHMIDFDKAKATTNESARDALKRIFPERHLHEFRYTFITRAKECGMNPEVVMLLTGHESDKDVKTSRVDRGYTTYSEEYIRKEISKYEYDLEI